MDVIVRVARGSYSDYIKPFEAGAQGIMAPHVRTAAEARDIVRAVRFAPVGERAIDGGSRDGGFALMDTETYIHHSLTERFVVLQIESPEAVANVDEIAAVEGFEFLMFGPGDFAHRSGIPGKASDPRVVEARGKVEEAAKRNGKWCFSAGQPAQQIPAGLEAGNRIWNVGSDLRALTGYGLAQLTECGKFTPTNQA